MVFCFFEFFCFLWCSVFGGLVVVVGVGSLVVSILPLRVRGSSLRVVMVLGIM